ncbi:aminoglycoside adenylyltransferase domain-containing protein [Nonomuraea sp. SYSU D8015]|uniref:aminoglycoside adenylyltransferase domain-containing protein n=1 Tax=Nonomuraea sp. SYSU D8015 TaxID=2593644 RepID=UPI0016607DBB|nr:aminoglycoside adenylyltransferase domain-containing protein [Nonomuraea sp. SYSU D8015]
MPDVSDHEPDGSLSGPDHQPGRPRSWPDHEPDRPQSWADCDPDIRDHVTGTLDAVGVPLLGAYLHGSLAMGCYHRAKSDLDLLLVTPGSLTATQRASVARALALRSADRPVPGDLEVSVLSREQAATHQHPRPYEVHCSSMWTADILAGGVDHDAPRADPDLAAHITVARERGVTLLGPPAETVFAPVPRDDYVAAITDDLAWAMERLPRSPYYGVLNACRVLAVLDGGPATVPSKEEGAAWALDELPQPLRPIVRQALSCYRSARPVPAEDRETDGHAWDEDALQAFATYVLRRAGLSRAG